MRTALPVDAQLLGGLCIVLNCNCDSEAEAAGVGGRPALPVGGLIWTAADSGAHCEAAVDGRETAVGAFEGMVCDDGIEVRAPITPATGEAGSALAFVAFIVWKPSRGTVPATVASAPTDQQSCVARWCPPGTGMCMPPGAVPRAGLARWICVAITEFCAICFWRDFSSALCRAMAIGRAGEALGLVRLPYAGDCPTMPPPTWLTLIVVV